MEVIFCIHQSPIKPFPLGSTGTARAAFFVGFFFSPQQYQYVSAEGRSTCCVTDLGVASGLYHLSPSGFARVLELPPIHLEGRLVWGLTGRAGPAGVWVLHPPLLQAPVSAQGNDVVLKGGEKDIFLGWEGVSIHAGMDGRCPNNPAWMGDAKSHGAGPRLCLHTCHGGVPGLQMEPPHEKTCTRPGWEAPSCRRHAPCKPLPVALCSKCPSKTLQSL